MGRFAANTPILIRIWRLRLCMMNTYTDFVLHNGYMLTIFSVSFYPQNSQWSYYESRSFFFFFSCWRWWLWLCFPLAYTFVSPQTLSLEHTNTKNPPIFLQPMNMEWILVRNVCATVLFSLDISLPFAYSFRYDLYAIIDLEIRTGPFACVQSYIPACFACLPACLLLHVCLRLCVASKLRAAFYM